MRTQVIVVGGGLTGLVAAWRLQRAGVAVELYEAAARPGGVIASTRVDGALLEHGPNTAMNSSPRVDALIADLGLAALRTDAAPAAARRYIQWDGRPHALPQSLGSFLSTPLLPARAKLRLLAEPFIARGGNDAESIAAFVRRRFGAGLLDCAVEPFVSGIYGGDPERIALASAFPRLRALEVEHGGVVRGALAGARSRRRSGAPRRARPVSFSFREGLQTLTDALAAGLPALHTGAAVTAIRPEGDSWHLQGMQQGMPFERTAAALVMAVPAWAAAALLGAWAPAAAAALAAIDYAPIACVAQVYARADIAHPLDGFGVLMPAREHPMLLGTLFNSAMFPARAPAGMVVLTTFIGGRREPAAVALDDAALVDRVRAALVPLLGLRGAPRASQVSRWQRGIPQYEAAHASRLAAVAALEAAHPGLVLAGNWRGGVSISDCIDAGELIAQRLHPGTADRSG